MAKSEGLVTTMCHLGYEEKSILKYVQDLLINNISFLAIKWISGTAYQAGRPKIFRLSSLQFELSHL